MKLSAVVPLLVLLSACTPPDRIPDRIPGPPPGASASGYRIYEGVGYFTIYTPYGPNGPRYVVVPLTQTCIVRVDPEISAAVDCGKLKEALPETAGRIIAW